jgi:hypothetical protein
MCEHTHDGGWGVFASSRAIVFVSLKRTSKDDDPPIGHATARSASVNPNLTVVLHLDAIGRFAVRVDTIGVGNSGVE